MRRRATAELLDDDAGSPAEIRSGLDDLWWINRRFGGLSGWRQLLAALPPLPRIRLLDVGAGRGELTAAVAALLLDRGSVVTAIALDRRPSHLGRGLPALAADAGALPFADASCELVMCNLFLHHFSGEAAVALLRELYRVAAVAVLVNDLERAWPPYLFARTLLRLRVSRLTRWDAPASVRQAYTRAELRDLAARAGVRRIQLLPLPAWRMGLIAWKSDAAL